MGGIRVLIMFLYGHMTQVWSYTGKQKGSQKQKWDLAFSIGITVASMSTSWHTTCGWDRSGVLSWKKGAALATLCIWHSEYSAYIFANSQRKKEKKNSKDLALPCKAAEKLITNFNTLAKRKCAYVIRLYNALLWGVCSPMRIKREGNYAVTAVKSTLTIAESNQKLLTCILFWHEWMLIFWSSSRGHRKIKDKKIN